MIMSANILDEVLASRPWYQQSVRRGMICVRVPDAAKELGYRDFECKDRDIPRTAVLIGSGGWDETGALHFVGIDLDVGHGNEKARYETRDDAIDAALRLRDFVGGAAEIRLSKSGNGVHIRVFIAGILANGRKLAALIAKWLARTMDLKCDPTVLGRQNLWFWAKQESADSFRALETATGAWTPPPAALKEPDAPPAPPIPRQWFNDASGILKRASLYIAKVAPAVAGQGGHTQTFKAACALVRGFGLSIGDARPLLYDWNRSCVPPWADHELEHKLKEASENSKLESGYLLRDEPETYKSWKPEQPTPTMRPSDLVKQQIQDEISGKRFAADWGLPMLQKFTLALLPSNVTMFCAPPGSSKSFFVLQAISHWMSKGYRPAVLELEEDRTYHLRRALAQRCEDGNITDPEWTKANPEKAQAYADQHAEYIDALSECIFDAPLRFNTDAALQWLSDRVAEKRRVIAIDPITARDPSEKPWIDDQHFVRNAEDILKKGDSSLLLVTHPAGDPHDTSLDNMAGGRAYRRFTQVAIFMKAVDPQEVLCSGFMSSERKIINRRVYLRKTRNGKAQNSCIGYLFNSKTLKFEECGIVPKEEK